jgi:hypothetical protein
MSKDYRITTDFTITWKQAKAWFPQSLPTPTEWLARKVDVEFVL